MTATTVAAMAPTTAAPVTCHSARTERGRLCSGRAPACAWSSPVSSDDVMGGGVPGQDPRPQTVALPGPGRGRGGAPEAGECSTPAVLAAASPPRRAHIPAAAALLTGISLLFATVPAPGGGHPALSADGTWAGWFDSLLGLSFAAEDPHAYLPSAVTVFLGCAGRLPRSGRRGPAGAAGVEWRTRSVTVVSLMPFAAISFSTVGRACTSTSRRAASVLANEAFGEKVPRPMP